MGRSVLYVTYDGLEEPLGQSQVLPYVKGLAALGNQFEILSFEKPGVPLCYRRKIAENIRWTALRYHRCPSLPATLWDMSIGKLVGAWLCIVARVNLIHVRSYVPCVMMFGWSKLARTPLLFDTRGLWADEKADSGSWRRSGFLYRIVKRIEFFLFKHVGSLTVLTCSFKRYLQDKTNRPVCVIPTCVDLKKFRKVGPSEPGLLVYAGSLGGLYMSQEIVRFYGEWRKHFLNPRLLLLTHSTLSEIKNLMDKVGIAHELEAKSVSHHDVPVWLSKAGAAVCFIKPSFSKLGSAPTKLGEFLACGLPVAANLIGDMGEVLSGSLAGVILDNFSEETIKIAAHTLAEASKDESVRLEARRLAEKWFSLEQGIQKYHEIYQTLCAA